MRGTEPRLSYTKWEVRTPQVLSQLPSPPCTATFPKFLPGHKSRVSSEALPRAPSSGAVPGAAWFKEGIQSPATQQIFIFIESVRSQLSLISVSHRNPPLSQPVLGKVRDASKESSTASPKHGEIPPATNLPNPSSFLQNSTEQGLAGNGTTNTTHRSSLEKATQLEIEAIQF